MKRERPKVTCRFVAEGEEPRRLLLDEFARFLARELAKAEHDV